MTAQQHTALIIDSDEAHARSLARALSAAGFDTVTSKTPARAMSILELGQVDALIVDVERSYFDGRNLIESVCASASDVRVVAMSENVERARSNGASKADLILEKPVDPERVVDFLKTRCAPAAGFSATVECVDILDFLQFLMLTGDRHALEIQSGDGVRGEIFVEGGNVVHAVCQDSAGEDAVYACLGLRNGRLRSRPGRDSGVRTIDKPGEYVLIEAARKRDDQQPEQDRVSDCPEAVTEASASAAETNIDGERSPG